MIAIPQAPANPVTSANPVSAAIGAQSPTAPNVAPRALANFQPQAVPQQPMQTQQAYAPQQAQPYPQQGQQQYSQAQQQFQQMMQFYQQMQQQGYAPTQQQQPGAQGAIARMQAQQQNPMQNAATYQPPPVSSPQPAQAYAPPVAAAQPSAVSAMPAQTAPQPLQNTTQAPAMTAHPFGTTGPLGGVGGLAMSDATQKVLTQHSLADDFLDHMRPYSYRYKDPRMEPRVQPTGGTYLGVMAQDLERIPHLGHQLVVDTPQGKMVDQKTALSATMAGLARIHERVKALETDAMKKGRK